MKKITTALLLVVVATVLTATLVLGAVASSGSTITIPAGKTAIYFTLDNADAAFLRAALCNNYEYQENIVNDEGIVITNPETCEQFGQKKITEFAKDHMKAYHKHLDEQQYSAPTYDITG